MKRTRPDSVIVRKVYGLTAIPIITLVVAFVAFIVIGNLLELRRIASDLASEANLALESELHNLSQEIFLVQPEATRMRIDRTYDRLKDKFDNAHICIRVVTSQKYAHVPNYEKCDQILDRNFTSLPIQIASETFGRIEYYAEIIPRASAYFPSHVFFAILCSLCLAAAASIVLSKKLLRDIVYPERFQALVREKAMVKTAQMFAHDVRKPFALIKAGVKSLKKKTDLNAIQSYIDSLDQEVSKSLVGIEDMIEDVVSFGVRRRLNASESSLESIITDSLQVIGDISPIDIALSLNHEKLVLVDVPKIGRVCVNLLQNAVDEMRGAGTISITSNESSGRTYLTIHNSGSFVPEDKREAIFTPFVTMGKKDGTGLGLAICRKLVEAHGGQLTCDSDEMGTTFCLDLETGNEADIRDASRAIGNKP